MSGRTRTILPDGRQVRGYRKTLRVGRRGVALVREPAAPLVLAADMPSAEYPVRLTFLLPKTILVSPGPHGFNVAVPPGNVVRIRGRTADHCFALARCFFAAVARESVGFTCNALITRDHEDRTYGRHLTVVREAVVVSGGLIVPKVFDMA
jgi:hypothetical protein